MKQINPPKNPQKPQDPKKTETFLCHWFGRQEIATHTISHRLSLKMQTNSSFVCPAALLEESPRLGILLIAWCSNVIGRK